MTHELTRRDALIALGASGVTVGGGVLAWDQLRDGEGGGFTDRQRDTLFALAHTVYPSPVANVESFVERYVVGKASERPEYGRGMADALDELDEYAETWEDVPFAELDTDERGELLRAFSVGTADPDPEGRAEERVRYYLVNELQFALYASPTGGELVGLENPQGHPGGIESYRRPPDDE